MIKNIIAVILITYGVFGFNILNINTVPKVIPVNVLSINEPTDEVKSMVKIFSDTVTDSSDRIKIAIFNYQFATNVINYNASLQDVNDIYTMAGKIFFKDSLSGKYTKLADITTELLSKVSAYDHTLTTEEKQLIHNYFMGVSWVLTHENNND